MSILTFNTDYSEERFYSEIANPLREKFPDLEVQHLRENLLFNHVEVFKKWNEADRFPDIHLAKGWSLPLLIEKNMCFNMSELLDSSSIKLEEFETGLLRRGIGNQGEILALPYENTMVFPLFYNKDIFDRFDAPYPEDGMTWSEVIERAKLVTGMKDGVQYYGLDVADLALLRMQLGVTHLDPITGEVSIKHNKWRQIAQTLKEIYTIPGNLIPFPNRKRALGFNDGYFVRQKVVAMGIVCASCFDEAELDFNWDIVSYPVHEDGFGPNIPSSTSLVINQSCHDKQLAFEVLSYLVSEEFQANNCKKGILTSWNNNRIHQRFGEELPIYNKKNIQAIYYNRPAMPPERELVQVKEIERELSTRGAFTDMIYDNMDVEATLDRIEREFMDKLSVERRI